MYRKLIALIVGFLLLTVVITPSIEAQDNTLKVSSRFYGKYQYNQPEIELTSEQLKDLKQILHEYKDKLDKVNTKSEAEDIFSDVINELDNYGLLGDVPKEEAYDLVTGKYIHQLMLQEYNIYSKLNILNDFPVNKQCLVYGNTDNTMFSSFRQLITGNILLTILVFITIIAEMNGDGLEDYLDKHPFISLMLTLGLNIWGLTMMIRNYVNPLLIACFVGIGTEEEPANGNLFTLGALGKKTWNDSIYIDITGFFGIKLVLDIETDQFFYFGYGSQVFEN